MSNMTAQQVIDDAYRKIGIETPTTVQSTNALRDLQNMLSSWSAEGLHVPYFTEENFTLTASQMVYTIGSGGDFDTVRPNSISNAFIRISNVDYPIDVLMTRSEYSRITTKTTEARPTRLYYDKQYPLGKIKFNYEADTTYDFHILSSKPLTNPTATSTTFSVPLEANQAIVYNLAILLSHDNDMEVPTTLFSIAASSKETLMAQNAIDEAMIYARLDDISGLVYQGSSMNINTGD